MAIKKVPQFDNLDDVKSKFVNTICLYENQPVFIKSAHFDNKPEAAGGGPDFEHFKLTVVKYGGKNQFVALHDPKFSYKGFNIGYANVGEYAYWWYRTPKKQFQQGLKRDQMSYLFSGGYAIPDDNFNFGGPYINMLCNKYPSMEEAASLLKDKVVKSMAFHRDFALSYDELHQDYILECKAKKVGVSLNGNLHEYRLLPEFNYLAESLQEALG